MNLLLERGSLEFGGRYVENYGERVLHRISDLEVETTVVDGEIVSRRSPTRRPKGTLNYGGRGT